MKKLRGKIRLWLPSVLVSALALILFVLPSWGTAYQTLVNDSISYEKGRVEQILSEQLEESTLKGGHMLGTQELVIRLQDGQAVEVTNYLTDTHNIQVAEGTRVIVCVDAPEGVAPYYTLYNYDRTGSILLIVAFFCLLMVGVGGHKGLSAAVAILFTLVFVLRVAIPAIYQGCPPVLVGIITVLLSTAVTILLLYGPTVRGMLAIGVTLAGEVLSCLIFLAFSWLLHLNGFQTSDAESLLVVAQNTGLDISTVLFAGTMIASLGAVMDVAVSLLSSLWEVRLADPEISSGALMRAGLHIARDMITTMSNTLIFAFSGGALMTVLVLFSYGVEANQLISSDYAALELAQGLCGTCAVILTVPLASFAAAICYPRLKIKNPGA